MNFLKKIQTKRLVQIALAILVALSLFHVLILVGLIPFDNVWGGRLTSHRQMLGMEGSALMVNVLIIWVLAMKGGYARLGFSNKVVTALLWAFGLLFLLSTLGNLLSFSRLEAMVFTPMTIVLALMFFVLANRKTISHKKSQDT